MIITITTKNVFMNPSPFFTEIRLENQAPPPKANTRPTFELPYHLR